MSTTPSSSSASVLSAVTAVALFGLYPVLSLVASNTDQLAPQTALRSAALALLASILALLAAKAVLRSWARAARLVVGLQILFFSYGHVYDLVRQVELGDVLVGRHRYLLALWGVAGLLWFAREMRLKSSPSLAWLLAAGAVLVALPAVTLVRSAVRTTQAPPSEAILPGMAATRAATETLPDIYYIILDAYGRDDVLQELYGIDSSGFLRFLEERGFYVAAQARSNYSKTLLSLASSLNMDYLDELVAAQGTGSNDKTPLVRMIQDSRVAQVLRSAGYQTVGLESGYAPTEWRNADDYRSPSPVAASVSTLDWAARGLNEFEILLLQGTLLRPALDKISEGQAPGVALLSQPYQDHRRRVLSALDQLPRLAAMPGPKLVFAHILIPHPPFVFGRNGEELIPTRPFQLMDIEVYDRQEYIEGYADQLLYLDVLLQSTLDGVLEASASPPIIILQGDHGPGAYMSYSHPLSSNMRDRLSILNAYLVPADVAARLYPSITPVNSFRLLLSSLLGADLPVLPDRSYFALDDLRPYDLLDVSDRSLTD